MAAENIYQIPHCSVTKNENKKISPTVLCSKNCYLIYYNFKLSSISMFSPVLHSTLFNTSEVYDCLPELINHKINLPDLSTSQGIIRENSMKISPNNE